MVYNTAPKRKSPLYVEDESLFSTLSSVKAFRNAAEELKLTNMIAITILSIISLFLVFLKCSRVLALVTHLMDSISKTK